MHTNNNHNKWSAGQLSNIIDSIRDSNNGKCSIRMVAERIGKNLSNTWQLLNDSGLITRLYRESLDLIYEQVQANASSCTISELYKMFGASWQDEHSFRGSLYKDGVLSLGKKHKTAQISANRLVKDYSERGYDFNTLTVEEVAEMYELSMNTTYRLLKRNQIPYARAPKGRRPKVKA